MQKIIFFWNELKSTFWFIPVLIIIAAIALALGLVYFDSQAEVNQNGVGRYLLTGSADSARSILTTISGAMIGIAGTVFSITLVVLTLASSQFGPRLIKNFMYHRLNQIVLGSYVSTYIYCLVVLNTIKENEEVVFIPAFSTLVAQGAALVNIILLILFIHNIAISIQADKVISDISGSLSRNMKVLFPQKMGDQPDEENEQDEDAAKSAYKEKRSFTIPGSGYLQYIDGKTLIELTDEINGLLELRFRPGDYLVEGVEVGLIYSNDTIDNKKIKLFQEQFLLGKTRTQQQDAEYSIRQMVEIAVRALSSGVNDPYTAIACIDNLTSAMAYLSDVKFPSRYRTNQDGELRIIAAILTYEGMLDAAFNQIRQFAKGTPSVVIRLMEALITISKFDKRQSYKKVIQKHAHMVLNMAEESFDEQNDLKDLKERSKLIMGVNE
jgi:uncharacterized membrane protein